VKYGKWVLLAGAAGMNVLALQAHDRADEAYDALRARCAPAHSLCALDDRGQYSDPGSEALYQATLEHDGEARRWLFGGEAALLGAAAMFVWELTESKGRPRNIPFEPEVSSRGGGLRIGVRSHF
jgi:hypothetical protein